MITLHGLAVLDKMKKTTYKWIDGILLALLTIGGATYYIQDSETKTSCRAGWVDVEDIEFEWQWSCTTASGIRYETCYEVYNSANTENYWCRKGKLVEINNSVIEIKQPEEEETPQIVYPIRIPKTQITCVFGNCT